jgi:hypothetical protein
MIYVYSILGVLAYAAGANFTFGYVAKLCNYSDPWEGPGPLLSATIWTVSLIFTLGRPITKLGMSLGEYLIEAEDKREELKAQKVAAKKLQIRVQELAEEKAIKELEAAERELEEQLHQYDEPSKRMVVGRR